MSRRLLRWRVSRFGCLPWDGAELAALFRAGTLALAVAGYGSAQPPGLPEQDATRLQGKRSRRTSAV
jgi:hypothetical protein